MHRLLYAAILSAGVLGCGGDDADSLGVGAQCTATDECDTELSQTCLTQFKGGYCGVTGCTHDADCPTDSACIRHDDQVNYCFRTCAQKVDCNANRDPVNEANCSSTAVFVDGDMGRKACSPPSGS